MGQYIRANDSYEDYKLFKAELNNIRKEQNAAYREARIDIYEYYTADNKIIAGINWGAWGTQPPEDTKYFVEALQYAIKLCEDLNNRFPDIEAW